MAKRWDLTINGRAVSVQAEPDMPLLWVLRDLVGLTGTKFGCGIAACGACIVHMAGEPVHSCQTTVSEVSGAITTVEGLPNGDELHAVQTAWIAEQAPQCGYCQPGQIMSAAALLSTNPTPSDAEIDEAMAGNLCRCGTYPQIRAAIKRAGKELSLNARAEAPRVGAKPARSIKPSWPNHPQGTHAGGWPKNEDAGAGRPSGTGRSEV